ncbi:hypothetical protein IGI44_003815 [Enterococcus sp. DIV0756]
MQTYLPTTDLLFRKMLTAPDSLHILKAFVKDLLGIEFQSLKPRETYHIETYKHFYEKNKRAGVFHTEVDILAVAEDGSHTTIECQVRSHPHFIERVTYYLAEAFRASYGNLTATGDKKDNHYSSLRPAYGINIMDFHLFDENQKALKRFHLLDEETHAPLYLEKNKELLILCFLSLVNENIEAHSPAWHWQYFLATGEVTDSAPDYIKEAKVKTDFANLKREEQKMIMDIEKAKAIHGAELSGARLEGRQEGRKEGLQLGREEGEKGKERELALKFLKIGNTLEQVSEVTGLDIETLKKLEREQE